MDVGEFSVMRPCGADNFREHKLQKKAFSLCLQEEVSRGILEICGDNEVAAAHELNHSLQVVLLFSCDPNLLILHLTLHFETLRLDRLNDFPSFVSIESLLDFQFLPSVTDG